LIKQGPKKELIYDWMFVMMLRMYFVFGFMRGFMRGDEWAQKGSDITIRRFFNDMYVQNENP
jgi:hypothetical protein